MIARFEMKTQLDFVSVCIGTVERGSAKNA